MTRLFWVVGPFRENLRLAKLTLLRHFFLMSTAEIEKMSTSERLATMEQLWDALCQDGNEPSSPTWHEEILGKRKERMNSPDARFITLDQIRDEFR